MSDTPPTSYPPGQDYELTIDPVAFLAAVGGPTGSVNKVLDAILAKAEGGAKRRCPVDTGRLRSSIVTAKGVDEVGEYGQIGTDVEYAAPVEFGHQTRSGTEVPPAAFLRGGLNEAIQDVAPLGGGQGGE